MISLELAKQLKDAGFPQGESIDKIISKGVGLAYLRESKPSDELLEKYESALLSLKELYQDDSEYVFVPTLSELIEACGERFSTLEYSKITKWCATAQPRTGDNYFGHTPDIATAKLWLILQGK